MSKDGRVIISPLADILVDPYQTSLLVGQPQFKNINPKTKSDSHAHTTSHAM